MKIHKGYHGPVTTAGERTTTDPISMDLIGGATITLSLDELDELAAVCRRYVRDTERFYGGADESLADRIALCRQLSAKRSE